MARVRCPDRDKAFTIWQESGGNKMLEDIANQLGICDSQISKWKNLDKWDDKMKGNVTMKKLKAKVILLLKVRIQKKIE